MKKRNLSLPVHAVSVEARNAVPYTATIWDRISPESRRAINKMADSMKGGK